MVTKARTTKNYVERGDSGVQIFNGIITGEEYNFNLLGRRALETWNEMRKSDATVKMSLKAVKEPIKSLPWYVQPASKEDKDVEVAEFVDGNLFDVLRWKTTLHEILTHQEMGFAVFEKPLEPMQIKGHLRVGLKRLSFRKQASILKWDAGDGKPGVTQYGSGGKQIPIPLENLVVFTNEQEGDNFEGTSILRPSYKHWYYKDKLYQIDAIGHERQALGVVKIKHPSTASGANIKKAEDAARALRANEEAFISEPNGWDINFMDMKAGSLKDTEPSINHHDRQIAVNVLAQFMNLGSTTGSGSRAVGEPQLKIFEQSVRSVAEYIADTINRYVIKELVDLNFNVTEYPKLSIGDADEKSIDALASAFKSLVESGAITPTEEDEAYLRGRLGLPERPEGEVSDDEDDGGEPDVDDESTGDVQDDKVDAALASKAKSLLASLKERIYGGSQRSD